MSVIFISECCSLSVCDQKSFTNNQLHHCSFALQSTGTIGEGSDGSVAEPAFQKIHLRNSLFEIKVPFLMDSEFSKYQRECVAVNDCKPSSNNPEKRKRKRETNDNYFNLDKQNRFLSLIQQTQFHWNSLSKDVPVCDNNVAARKIAKDFADINVNLPYREMFENSMDVAVLREHYGDQYIIPAKSRYCCSLLSDIDCLLTGTKYDLVVIDPPWNNKSAKRLRTYDYVDEREFAKIPVARLAKPGCLICLWVTNNERLKSFAEYELFPSWGVKKIAEWMWMKVTMSGEPVFALNSPHKKPYEVLLIGRIISENSGIEQQHSTIPVEKIVVSVPSAVHSHKPCLNDLMRPFLPPEANCLELFARSLCANWTSWGLEVLKFQHSSLYEFGCDQQ